VLQQLLHLVAEGQQPAGQQQGTHGLIPTTGAAGTSCCIQQVNCWPDMRSQQLLLPQQRLLAAQQVLTQLDTTSLGGWLVLCGCIGHQAAL
jgi:hypothetical protein